MGNVMIRGTNNKYWVKITVSRTVLAKMISHRNTEVHSTQGWWAHSSSAGLYAEVLADDSIMTSSYL